MTSTIKLRRLILSNFGPFVGDHSLELPPSGLHMVLGENLDTDESSGAGKSSLVESLAYAFDYSTFAATDLQSWSWLTEEPMSVGIGFSCPAGEVEYRRGKKAYLTLQGKEPVTSAKAVKEELGRLVGVRPEILKALTYRPQGQPGLFLSMTDQEKKSFLTELLGLQAYETETERVVKVITDLEQQVDTKRAIADAVGSQVPPEPAPQAALDTTELEKTVDDISSEIDAAQDSLGHLKAADSNAIDTQSARETEVRNKWLPLIRDLNSELNGLRSPAVTSPERPEPPAELSILRKKLSLLREAVAKAKEGQRLKVAELRLDLKESRLEAARLTTTADHIAYVASKEKSRFEEEVAVLRMQTCFTCERPWSDEAHTAKLTNRLADIQKCVEQLARAEDALKQAEEQEHKNKELDLTLTFEEKADPVPEKLKAGEQEFAQKVADVEAEYKALIGSVEQRHRDAIQLAYATHQKRVAEARTAVAKAENDYVQELHAAQEMTTEHVRIRDGLSSSKELLNGLLSDRRVIQDRIESARTHHRALGAQLKHEMNVWLAAGERAQKARNEYALVVTGLDQERDYLGCIRSFLGVIFDETLNRIAHLTNERMGKVPNVQELTLRFVSERETKTTKNMRQEIRSVIERDGREIPLKRTSGGQYTSVELAVDLSLADVIAERTGVMPGWLILDEAFNGLPTKSKTACLELLKNAAETRLILVIDHATEIKEMFDSVIVVRSQDGRSSFA